MDDFSVRLTDILADYAEEVQEAVAQAVEETGKRALKTVRAKSPVRKGRGGGRYKKGWRMQKVRSGVFGTQSAVTIYNAADGPLVHLLEHGHQKAGGGRVAGIPHVQPAADQAARLLPELVQRAIEEAGG